MTGFNFRYYSDLDANEGHIVSYGAFTTPSYSYWMVPGTATEVVVED